MAHSPRFLRFIGLGACVAAALAMGLVPDESHAKKKKRRRPTHTEYTIPISCGIDGLGAVHETTIDLHNGTGGDATLLERLSLSNPAGSLSDDLQQVVGAGLAAQLTCLDLDIFPFAVLPGGPYPGFYQGFLVVQSRVRLTVQVTRSVDQAGDLSLVSGAIAGRPMFGSRDAGQVAMCHIPPGNPSAAHMIYIDPPAVPAHLGHGDVQGACIPVP